MSASRRRTLYVELPDDLVRRSAAHIGPEGGFSAVVQRALELWLEQREYRNAADRGARRTMADPGTAVPSDPRPQRAV